MDRQRLFGTEGHRHTETRFDQRILWVRFDGPLDVDRFTSAWELTANAHDALSLIIDSDKSLQRFDVGDPELRLVDLQAGTSFDLWLNQQATKEFAPRRQPWEATLVRGNGGEVGFAFRAHCQICDEKSLQIIAQEVDARYEGRPTEACGQLRDFLISQQDNALGSVSHKQRDAWRLMLADPPPVAVLLGRSHRGGHLGIARHLQWLDTKLRDVAVARAQSEPFRVKQPSSPLDLVLLTAIFGWIGKLSDQTDLVVSISRDRRSDAATRTVGPLSDAFFLRVTVTAGDTFLSLANKVASALEFANLNAAVSLGDPDCATAILGPTTKWPSTFCGNPASYNLGDASVFAPTESGSDDRKSVLVVRQIFIENSLGLAFDFERSSYDGSMQSRLVEYFLNLLSALLDDPSQRLDDVDWLPSTEVQQLRQWGRGNQPETAPDLLERFDHWVREIPAQVAANFGDAQLTYENLDRLTNRLASRLRSLGVGRESRVAVAMPRGFGELVALLSTLKANGAYVPVDPSHPIDRVRLILEDAAPEVLIAPSNSALLAALPRGAAFCSLDDLERDTCGFPEIAAQNSVPADDQLAYILFTSGSTGRPKGVEITRAAFANFLQSMAHQPGLNQPDRVLAITTTTFDISGLELFLPLYVGASIVIADKETAMDPIRLRALVERSGVTLMQATPSTWRLLLDAGWQGHPQLRMLCGGEAMSRLLAQRLLTCGAELWNVYGPTETTVWSTIQRIVAGDECITVGHAIDHTQVSVRNRAGRLVTTGAIGEICIGGRGLARGYLGNADLTAQRFCFDSHTGERYYRTGDLGRFLDDGRLECLGRADHQVKIRGYRIEPADIEAQLRAVPRVAEVLVVARSQDDEDPVLVAYWTGDAEPDALHRAAKNTLPPYMVPSRYVHLDAFPLTTSGKIDRKKLPGPDAAHSPCVGDEGDLIGPRNDRESIVAAMFRDILGLTYAPVNQDFFSLGGTSVRAVSLRGRIADAFGVELPLQVLFQHPTVEAIVRSLDATPTNPDDPVLTWIKPGGTRPAWIGIMGIHLFEDISRALPVDQPLLAIHVPARYVPNVDPFPSVVELAQKYLNAIRREVPRGPYFLLGLCHGGVVAFETAVQLEQLGEQVGAVALLDAELHSARQINERARLRHFAERLVVEPQQVGRRVLDAIEKRFADVVRLAAPRRSGRRALASEVIDMPFDGPEIDRELLTYERLSHRTQTHVINLRATKNDLPSWVVVEPDLGWKDRARTLESHAIAATHLEIVREPACRQVARYLDAAKRGLGM